MAWAALLMLNGLLLNAAAAAGDVVPVRGAPAPTRCDHLAAYGADRDRVARGVDRDQIDLPRAIRACRDDLRRDPGNPRLNYQLSRLYGYTGDIAAAADYRGRAMAAGYPIAIYVAGYMKAFPATGGGDPCGGAALMRQAAQAGAFAGEIGLTAYVLDGSLAGCADLPRRAELLGFLSHARAKAEGHFELLLVQSLTREVERLP